MKPIVLITELAALLIVSACSIQPTITDAERNSIRTVRVDPQISMPPYPKVWGPEANKAGLVIIFAALATAERENEDSVRFRQHLEANKIVVHEIVRQEFATQLTSRKIFPAIVVEGGDASLSLKVDRYGLGPVPFSLSLIDTPLRQVLILAATLTTRDGKVLWEDSGVVNNNSTEMPSYLFEVYLGTPDVTRDGFKKAAEAAVKELLDKLEDTFRPTK